MSLVSSQRPRFRIILPTLYLIIGGALFTDCFLHMGHSKFCEYSLYSMLPAGYVAAVLLSAIVPWAAVGQSSPLWTALEFLSFPIPLLLTCFQYYLLGVLVDRLLSKR